MSEGWPISRGTTKDSGFRAVVLVHFFTMFNDNAFRMATLLMAFHVSTGRQANFVASVANVLFLLPYALFSLAAGVLADRSRKQSVFFAWKLIEPPVVITGLVGLWMMKPALDVGPTILALGVLTFLGVQAAFLGPTRYGLLPEILDDDELSHGNGDLEMGGYTGTLLGTLAAGLIVQGIVHPESFGWALGLMPVISIAAAISSLYVPKLPPTNPTASLIDGINPKAFVRNWRGLASQKGLIPAVFGLTVFWGIFTLDVLNATYFGDVVLGFKGDPSKSTPLLIAIAIGIGLGSYFAGRLSLGTIELGLVPVGAVGWAIASGALSFASTPASAYIWLTISGVFAGLFFVPLNAFLERHSSPRERATWIATANVVTVTGMISASALQLLLGSTLGIDPRLIFLIAGVLLVAASDRLFRALPDFFVRFFLMGVTRIMYRRKVVGRHNIPSNGPALLVLNHTSFMDGNLVVSCFKRFVRFVVYRGHYDNRVLRWAGETMQAIPIDSTAPPKEIIKSIRRASEALENGDLVCVFAEGTISRTGFLMPFQRGFELILKKAPNVPIIPGFIDGMWGSVFSFHQGRFFKKWPKRWRFPVTIMFGRPLPSGTTSMEVRKQVQLLSAECLELRTKKKRPLHRQFLRAAKKFSRRPCMADASTPTMTYGQTLMRSVILTRLLSRKLGPARHVGVFVPPSVAGALTNIALSNSGKIPVNLNYTLTLDTINLCVRKCEITHVVASKKFVEKMELRPDAELIFLEDLRRDLRLADKLAGAATRILPAWAIERMLLNIADHSINDVATVVFSSGSTGEPKGIVLSHANISSNVDAVVQHVDATQEDAVLGVLPFFHSFGYTITVWLPILIGAKVIYHFSPLEAETVGKLNREHKATIFLSTATFLRQYLRRCDKDDFKTNRLIVCGAEKLPMPLAAQFAEKFGIRPLEGYGCTELSPVVSANRPDVIHGNVHQIGQKPGSIGHPIPGVAVKIVDPEMREDLPVGAEGLLLVKGPNVMQGYLGRPDLTAAAIQNGWYVTGDIAKLDEDGFLTITDRESRFSKVGGEMVPHGRIEEIIHETLNTTDRLCVVVGVPDERKGERLAVVHTPLPVGIPELWTKLKDSPAMPPLWLPNKNSFFEVEQLPVLGSGKIDLKGIKKFAQQKMAKD